MYAISTGRWSRAVGQRFVRDRVYLNGWRWTPFVKLSKRSKAPDSLIIEMRKLMEVQGSNGTWNYDPYMQGMYNGMELMMSMAESREPVYKEAPETWRCDLQIEGLPQVIGTTE